MDLYGSRPQSHQKWEAFDPSPTEHLEGYTIHHWAVQLRVHVSSRLKKNGPCISQVLKIRVDVAPFTLRVVQIWATGGIL